MEQGEGCPDRRMGPVCGGTYPLLPLVIKIFGPARLDHPPSKPAGNPRLCKPDCMILYCFR